jgi:hypothetical protein
MDHMQGTLPPAVAADKEPLSCFDIAWDVVEFPFMANVLAERQGILKEESGLETLSKERINRATEAAYSLPPIRGRELIHDFFKWQAKTTVAAPLHLSARLLYHENPENVSSYRRIPLIAESIVTGGFLSADLAQEVTCFMREDLENRSPISRLPSIATFALAAGACCTLPTMVALGPVALAGLVSRDYMNVRWSRREYSIGYIREVLDTHQALSMGNTPTIIDGLQSHFRWTKGERFRADGYMIARTLRLLEVPSDQIHEAFATTASVELQNQPLINLLVENLAKFHLPVPECLAMDYLSARRNHGQLARVLDALQECFFTWGKRSKHLYQEKMVQLLENHANGPQLTRVQT